jgi:hypothetical protein
MKTLAIAAVLAAVVAAQAQPQMDMKPPPEMQKVAWMVGEWKGNMKMHMPGMDQPMDSASTISARMGVGGRYLVVNFMSAMGDMGATEHMELITYDPAQKKWVCWGFDSVAPGTMESSGDLMGNKMVVTSKPMTMPGGPPDTFRTTVTKKSDTEFDFLLEHKVNDAWTSMIEGTFTKS